MLSKTKVYDVGVNSETANVHATVTEFAVESIWWKSSIGAGNKNV